MNMALDTDLLNTKLQSLRPYVLDRKCFIINYIDDVRPFNHTQLLRIYTKHNIYANIDSQEDLNF